MDSKQVSDGQVSNGLKDLLRNVRDTVVAQWARYSCEKSNSKGANKRDYASYRRALRVAALVLVHTGVRTVKARLIAQKGIIGSEKNERERERERERTGCARWAINQVPNGRSSRCPMGEVPSARWACNLAEAGLTQLPSIQVAFLAILSPAKHP